MNYKLIHDKIICRAKNRKIDFYTEKHHIIPKCEGGDVNGECVKLTIKEHRLIHLLRYKFTGILENLYAANMMKYSDRERLFSVASKLSHKKRKEKNPEKYFLDQRICGKIGGIKCRDEKIGFHNLSEEEKNKAREKGRETLVKNKLGMFSDEYREKHKKKLMKKIKTPDNTFDSMKEAAIYYQVSPGTITYRVNSDNFKNWYFI